MKKSANKTSQLQIRVSPEQKAQIAKSAKVAGMSMSDWVLAQALKNPSPNFQNLVAALS